MFSQKKTYFLPNMLTLSCCIGQHIFQEFFKALYSTFVANTLQEMGPFLSSSLQLLDFFTCVGKRFSGPFCVTEGTTYKLEFDNEQLRGSKGSALQALQKRKGYKFY